MKLGAQIVNLLFPGNVVCKLCGKETLLVGDGMCEACQNMLERYTEEIVSPAELDGLTAALIYNDAVAPAIRRLKYGRQVWLAPFLADFITLPPQWHIDCFVPVPLHPLREWMRTFNQSALLAHELYRRYPYPVRPKLLRRTRYTVPQAKLGAEKRSTNLTGAFAASQKVEGLSIVLIDDVTTTHATLIACAKALRKAGAAHVYGACVCIAIQKTNGGSQSHIDVVSSPYAPDFTEF